MQIFVRNLCKQCQINYKMLGQQIQVQSSISPQTHIFSFAHLQCTQQQSTQLDIIYQINLYPQPFSTDERRTIIDQKLKKSINGVASVQTKKKLHKLQEMYQQGLYQLESLKEQAQLEERRKTQTKYLLEAQLKLFSQHSQENNTSTLDSSPLSEEEEKKRRLSQKQSLNDFIRAETMPALLEKVQMAQRKLELLRETSRRKSEEQLQRIQQLKQQLRLANELQVYSQSNKQKCVQSTEEQNKLQDRLSALVSSRQELIQQNLALSTTAKQSHRNITRLSNSAEYLRATQICCQEILNQELRTLMYKLESRKIQYDSTKRYLEKVIRSRKYEDNLSFHQIEDLVFDLNKECEAMMRKKNSFIPPEIKRYKQKRLAIVEEITTVREKIMDIDNQKNYIEKRISMQNVIHDELQDQYCTLLQKADLYIQKKSQQFTNADMISPQEKVEILKLKQQTLIQQLERITTLNQQFKLQINNDHGLVPQSIIKDLQHQIKLEKQQLTDIQVLTKENAQLEKENCKLIERKDQMQQKNNPDVQKLVQQEKSHLQAQNILKLKLNSLNEQNQNIGGKIRELEKMKSQKISNQINQSKHQLSNQLSQLKTVHRQGQKQQQRFQKQKPDEEKRLQRHQQVKKNSGSKAQKSNGKQNTFEKKITESRGLNLQIYKENSVEGLQKGFPLDQSQDTCSNRSLIKSNPAFYMFLIFFSVVIPGLCILYNI